MSAVVRMLATNARYSGSSPAYVFADRVSTWSEVAARTGALAAGLRAQGLTPGDRVAVLTDNCPEMIELFLAAGTSGIIMAPVSTRLHQRELDRYFGEYLRPRAAVLGPGSAGGIGDWVDSCDVVIDLAGGPGGHLPYDDLLTRPGELDLDRDPHETFAIGQTSGTTGQPRGAEFTQFASAAGIRSFLAEYPMRRDDTYLLHHPISNVPAGPGILFPIGRAARTVILGSFSPDGFFDAVADHGITHTVLVPAMLTALLDHPRMAAADLSSLRSIICGASPIPQRLLERGVDAFGEVFVPAYGMTESLALACTLQPPDMYPVADQPANRLLSTGKPAVGVELLVVGDDDQPVPADGATFGEVLLRGDNVVRRYAGEQEENATSWTPDGWFRTGDMATVDGDGFITLVDRRKDIIISGGTNVASREVEDVIAALPGVAEVAVVGRPDDRWVEAVTAIVVATDTQLTAEQVIAHARTHLGGPKIPKSVEFVDALPRNNMGKVLKRELRRAAPR